MLRQKGGQLREKKLMLLKLVEAFTEDVGVISSGAKGQRAPGTLLHKIEF